MPCHDHPPSKRKHEDCADGGAGDGDCAFCFAASACGIRRLNDSQSQEGNHSRSVPAETELATACSESVNGESSMSNSGTGAPQLVRFFVVVNGKSITCTLNRKETILALHKKLQSLTGMWIQDQRLVFRGKQLRREQTLEDCAVEKDSNLYLVSLLRSTKYPWAYNVAESIVATIMYICKGGPSQDFTPTLTSLKDNVKAYVSAVTDEGISDQVSDMSISSFRPWVMEQLKVFLNFETPKALVALYGSSLRVNRDCAEECIGYFIGRVNQNSDGTMINFFMTILQEFCKLLMPPSGESSDDNLYLKCRGDLGSVAKIVGVASRPDCFEGKLYLIGIRGLSPILGEVALRLRKELSSSLETNGANGPVSRHVSDFSSLQRPMHILLSKSPHGGFISAPIGRRRDTFNPFWKEINRHFAIFTDLCGLMDQCLEKVEKYVAVEGKIEELTVQGGWYQYLAILKELSSIAEHYEGAEDNFWNMMRCRRASLRALIVRFSERGNDYRWLYPHKNILDFESRRHLAMLMLPEDEDLQDHDELFDMLIERSNLFSDSYKYIAHAEPTSLRDGLLVEFKDEEATGPGVLREWFSLVCQEIFNLEHALFVPCPQNPRKFFPNPASKADALHLQYFRFSGRFIALALTHRVQIGISLDRAFLAQLAQRGLGLEDVRDADPYIYGSCKQILEMDPELIDSDALGLTFVRELEVLGSRETVELCPGGQHKIVNSENRNSFVQLLIEHCFVTSISEQVSHFSLGVDDVLSSASIRSSFFECLEPEDLDAILLGSGVEIPLDDWKSHTEYHGYTDSDPQVLWFWEVVGDMCEEQRKVLLFFWTSLKYLPFDGFRGLESELLLYRSLESSECLPSSHTCFFQLCIPPYPSKEVMQDRLRVITQEHIGYSFGTE